MENDSRLAADLRKRIYSVDFVRGLIMMIMLLDHVREFVHAGALQSNPTDPETSTVAIFFTRWITHFCAPAFVFLSGTSIFLQKMNGKENGELSRFLLTRGLWLVFLEFTLVRLGIFFNFDYSVTALIQVIWVIGISMILMAAVIYLPLRIIGLLGVAMIGLHNLLDGIAVRQISLLPERRRRISGRCCGYSCIGRASFLSRPIRARLLPTH